MGSPRRAVINQAWRAIGPGVELLSSDDGGPLSRTVKRIIDPLVLRLRSNPQYSAPVVDPATATLMHDAILGSAVQLCSAASWFDVLKAERRNLRIRSGNAQELYFPVCFELAITKGPPAAGDRETPATVLHEIHQGRDRTAIEVLHEYLASPEVVAALTDQLSRSWRDVRAPDSTCRAAIDAFRTAQGTALGPAPNHGAVIARQRAWSMLAGSTTAYDLGALARVESGELPWSIVALGLSSVAPQQPPPSMPAPPATVPWTGPWWIGCVPPSAAPWTEMRCQTAPYCARRKSTGPAPHGACSARTSRRPWWPGSKSPSNWPPWTEP
ncbi:hypothetical protein I551_6945 [Mycobacterium ulcerans str. Harvey]|uniref:Uncharacterized protein n=1 Tax=Mycobacterium ulcerans str. Harvey TaxID=1299332 RepID=A0ABP3A756_MYCUL|nr:hypothetical protein I551_6945 [Mycobacterium ulcerans str. Harvey]